MCVFLFFHGIIVVAIAVRFGSSTAVIVFKKIIL